jgi:mono/diheme cytochrome c family protein
MPSFVVESAMVRIVVITFMGLGLIAGTASAQTAAIERGTKVYAAEKCSVCHSIGDQGNRKGPLDSVGSKLSAEEIRQWLVNAAEMAAKTKATRKPVMRSYTHLSKEDTEALVAYMLSLKKT